MSNNFLTSISIHTALKDWIEAKSKRDNIKFTSYQLANALSMPRSIITKLTHPDKSKRIINPRIETLVRIVEFFRKDGFDVSLDDLLSRKSKEICIQSLELAPSNQWSNIDLYSLNDSQKKLGTIDVTLTQKAKRILAFYAEEDVTSFFKAGSIFVIDTDMLPDHDNLIAIRENPQNRVHIKKYFREKGEVILTSINKNEESITVTPTLTYEILGVVIQINVKD